MDQPPPEQFNRDLMRWDRFRAFHWEINTCALVKPADYGHGSPLIMFDTMEVICVRYDVGPGERRHYGYGLEIRKSGEVGELYTPTGEAVPNAWLDDNGQQLFLIDNEQDRVVRLDGDTHHSRVKDKKLVPGIPHRFQDKATAYIPGPGMPAIGNGKIRTNPTIRAGSTPEQREHVDMLLATFRAQMKLTDDPCVSRSGGTTPFPFELALRCADANDVPMASRAQLFHNGIGRPRIDYDYLLLTRKP